LLAFCLVALVVLTGIAVAWSWRARPAVSALGWPVETPAASAGEQVTVTWLGITTLLFDDGETQILTDGTFSRPGTFDIVTQQPIYSDLAAINLGLAEYRIDRLAALIPLHSHFDHAMDIGAVANRTTAVILGSESAANIARGANVPVDQYQILADGESRQFGRFTITLLESTHVPIGIGDESWFAGTIEEALPQPASAGDLKGGVSWSVLISHPQGTALVQGSAGFITNKLPEDSADVVLLSVAGLSGLGPGYVRRYWDETVTRTGASRAYPLHFDDYTQPFGTLGLLPAIVDDVVQTARWIDRVNADAGSPVTVRRLPLGRPVVLFPAPP
jgi:L-ascorbate metabolism protein UlaG (beta-lactamase superfamily)